MTSLSAELLYPNWLQSNELQFQVSAEKGAVSFWENYISEDNNAVIVEKWEKAGDMVTPANKNPDLYQSA